MALQPKSFSSQEMLQPGARGDMFVNNGMPGHRDEGERINRSNNQLDLSAHDVLNNKYGLDPRLPSLFRYGWAHGYNQVVIPKGRIVAADPHLMVLDTETEHFFNAVTIANGGDTVRLAQPKDFQVGGQLEKLAHKASMLIGKLWVKLDEDEVAEQDHATLQETGGYLKINGAVRKDVRPANVPIGLLERNEYTRSADAYNGIMFGPIRTDTLVELPWFTEGEKAMLNPWGSAIGNFKPGDLVKSDENGRFAKSPLSDPEFMEKVGTEVTFAEYEKERRQIVGEVYSTDATLIPEGAARYAQWALSDRMKFNDFHPFVYPQNGRDGEDFTTNPPTAYQSDFRYPGYPMERGFLSKDLNMLAASREGTYDPRFDETHRLDRGIPGLTDGYNAIVKAYRSSLGEQDLELNGKPTATIGKFQTCVDGEELNNPDRFRYLMRLQETAVEKMKVGLFKADGTEVGSVIITESFSKESTPLVISNAFEVTYADIHKGLIEINQKAAFPTKEELDIKTSYVKRGQAGVPTNLDWDGCKGTVIILMNK